MLEQDRKKLEKILIDYITDAKIIKNKADIAEQIKDHVRVEKFVKLINGHISFHMFDDSELYFISKYFYKTYLKKDLDINPELFFSSNEIAQYERSEKINYSDDKINKIILHDVIETIPNRLWSCGKVTAQEIQKIFNNGLIRYNFETQRPSELIINSKGEPVHKIRVNEKSINSIADAMLKGEYFPTTLVFNVFKNGYEKVEYDENKKTLIIEVDEESIVDIVDGWHRASAIMKALRQNPNLGQVMKVDVYRMNTEEARSFICQENTRNDFDVKELQSYYNTKNIYTIMVDEISQEGTENTNFMKNKIARTYEEIKMLGKYCMYSTLKKAIEDNFDIDEKDIRQRRKVKDFLVEFFNELIAIFEWDFQKIENSREEFFITYNNMFYGYVALASKLYGVEKWQDKLEFILNQIDFSKEADIWKGKGIELKELPPRHIHNLYNYFKGLYDSIYNTEIALTGGDK